MTFGVETLSAIRPEMDSMIPEEWREAGGPERKRMALDINDDAYRRLESAGLLHVVTARADGALAGYFVALVMPHPHHRHTLAAFMDVLFLRKEHRRGRVGIDLLKTAERTLRARGVRLMQVGHTWSEDRKHTDRMVRLFRRLGYHPAEIHYSKLLEGAE